MINLTFSLFLLSIHNVPATMETGNFGFKNLIYEKIYSECKLLVYLLMKAYFSPGSEGARKESFDFLANCFIYGIMTTKVAIENTEQSLMGYIYGCVFGVDFHGLETQLECNKGRYLTEKTLTFP